MHAGAGAGEHRAESTSSSFSESESELHHESEQRFELVHSAQCTRVVPWQSQLAGMFERASEVGTVHCH